MELWFFSVVGTRFALKGECLLMFLGGEKHGWGLEGKFIAGGWFGFGLTGLYIIRGG